MVALKGKLHISCLLQKCSSPVHFKRERPLTLHTIHNVHKHKHSRYCEELYLEIEGSILIHITFLLHCFYTLKGTNFGQIKMLKFLFTQKLGVFILTSRVGSSLASISKQLRNSLQWRQAWLIKHRTYKSLACSGVFCRRNGVCGCEGVGWAGQHGVVIKGRQSAVLSLISFMEGKGGERAVED